MLELSKKIPVNTTANPLYKDIYAHLITKVNERNVQNNGTVKRLSFDKLEPLDAGINASLKLKIDKIDYKNATEQMLVIMAKESTDVQYSKLAVNPIILNLGNYFSKYSFEEYHSDIVSLKLLPDFELTRDIDNTTSRLLKKNGLGSMILNTITYLPVELQNFVKQSANGNAKNAQVQQKNVDRLIDSILNLNKGMKELQKVIETNEMSYGKEIVNYSINLTLPVIRFLSHQTTHEYVQEKIAEQARRSMGFDNPLLDSSIFN